MSAKRQGRWLTIPLVLLAMSGCGTPDTVPEDRFYRLSVLTAKPLDAPLIDSALVIAPVTAYDVYRDRAIAYSPVDEPGSLQHHHYHFWVAPPTELIRDQLVDYLRQTGIATTVATESFGRTQRPARLATRLTRFERALQADGSIKVAVGLQFTLEIEDRVLLRQHYDGTTPAVDDTFSATVLAADKGLAKIYRQAIADIESVVSKQGR